MRWCLCLMQRKTKSTVNISLSTIWIICLNFDPFKNLKYVLSVINYYYYNDNGLHCITFIRVIVAFELTLFYSFLILRTIPITHEILIYFAYTFYSFGVIGGVCLFYYNDTIYKYKKYNYCKYKLFRFYKRIMQLILL